MWVHACIFLFRVRSIILGSNGHGTPIPLKCKVTTNLDVGGFNVYSVFRNLFVIGLFVFLPATALSHNSLASTLICKGQRQMNNNCRNPFYEVTLAIANLETAYPQFRLLENVHGCYPFTTVSKRANHKYDFGRWHDQGNSCGN